MENVDKEFLNQLKFEISNFNCKDKKFESGFIGGLYYVLLWIEYGKTYADHKIDWDKIGREGDNDGKDSVESGAGCGC